MGLFDKEKSEKEQYRELERLKTENEIETERESIAAKKAREREMEETHGKGWAHTLGVKLKGIRPNTEVMQDLFSVDPELKDLSRPRGIRKLGGR